MTFRSFLIFFIALVTSGCSYVEAQSPAEVNAVADSIKEAESINDLLFHRLQQQITKLDSLRKVDSLQKVSLEKQLANLKASDEIKRIAIEKQLGLLEANKSKYESDKNSRLDSLRQNAVGYPVVGLVKDTLFTIYMRVGSYGPAYRAKNIHDRLQALYEEGFSNSDTLTITHSGDFADICYQDRILMTVTQHEALWHDTNVDELAEGYSTALTQALHRANDEFSTSRLLKRIGVVVALIVALIVLIRIVNLVVRWVRALLQVKSDKWLKDWKYKDYIIISKSQELKLLGYVISTLRILLIVLIFMVGTPLIFSVFPFSRDWSGHLFRTISTPVRELAIAVWGYLPNLLVILFIYIVMRLLSKLAKYFFTEIELSKLRIPGFHPEFAKPTYTLVRILFIAFFMILIFPYLPGSGSPAFNGISVFVGILVSFGSSSAIANMIAGIVITYMRPFKVGDRIKIEEIKGDVLEKNLLVTRLKTVTNEEITIPNSKVLTAATINYSSLAESKGLILSTEVTFGFEIAWQEVEAALLEAISRCDKILKAPKPFVLQDRFDDNYVVYLVNGYTTDANAQAKIYSEIRAHIQDVCRERDLELLSPHYTAYRDGTERTIPPEYTADDEPIAKQPSSNTVQEKTKLLEKERKKRQEEAQEWQDKRDEKQAEQLRKEQQIHQEKKNLEKEGLQSEQKENTDDPSNE